MVGAGFRLKASARVAAAGGLVLIATILFHHSVLIPYRLNLLKRVVKIRTVAVMTDETPMRPRVCAQNVVTMTKLMTPFSIDADALMVRALNYRLLGRNEDAVADYHRANELDERPEIHFQLAQLYSELGDQAAQERHRLAATEFHPSYSEP